MNFHETQMGQIFFNHQLPKLIQTLQEIAAGLSYRLPHMEWTAVKADSASMTCRSCGVRNSLFPNDSGS